MFAPPPARGSAGRLGYLTAAPILAICCLLFIGLLIASTIVLALIPVYIPNHASSAGAANTSPIYYVTLSFSNTAVFDGALSQAAITSIEQQIETAANLPPGSVIVVAADISSTPVSTRKRRSLNPLRTRRALRGGYQQQLFLRVRFNYGVCPYCLPHFVEEFVGVTVTLTIVLFGQTFTITCTVLIIELIPIPIPPFHFTPAPNTTTTIAPTANPS